MCRERGPDGFRPPRMGLVRAGMEDALLQASVRKKADDALRVEVEFRKRKSGEVGGAMDVDRADVSCAKMKRFCPILKSDRPTNRKMAGVIPPAAGDAKKSGTESSAEWSLLEDSAEGSTRAASFSVSTGRLSKSSSVSESEGQGANWKESYSSADDDNSDGWTKGGTAVLFTDYSRVPWPSEEREGAGKGGQLPMGGFLCEGRRRRGSSVAAMGLPRGVNLKAAGGSGSRANETDFEGNFGLFRRATKDGNPCLKRLTNDSGARGSAQGVDRSKERRERGVPADDGQARRKDGQSEESGDGRRESLANRSQSDDSGEVRAKLAPLTRRQNDGAGRLRWKDVQASTVSTGDITDERSDEQRTTGASGRADAREDPGGGGGLLCWGLSTVKRGRSESADCTSSELQESRSDCRANEVTSVAKDDKRPRDWRALGSGNRGGREEGADFSFRGLLSSEDKGNDLQQVGSTITEEGESDAKSRDAAANTESTGPVKFVLSSGRKTAYGDRDADGDARMGKKELTIDEEFELHFSQMFI